jgi:hypothetical protein
LRLCIIRIISFDFPPDVVGFGSYTAKISDDKLVLRFKMRVERHLVRPGGFGDRVDTNATKSAAMEEISRCGEDPRAGRRDDHKFIGHICFLLRTVLHDPLDRVVTEK